MHHQRTAILLLAILAMAPPPASARWLSYQGDATSIGGSERVYVEQHFIRMAGEVIAERVVSYRCPDGPAFARKRVDYSTSTTAPGFELDDGRSGYREGARHTAGGLELFVDRAGETARREVVVLTDSLVADAGFDEFVRQQWDRLVAGEPVRLDFALPARLDAYGFRIGRRAAEADGELQLRLQLRGLLGWAAPNIDVAYSIEDRRLIRYAGLSNLSDPRGRPWQVRIDFPHPPTHAESAAVELALAEPLADCSA